MPARARSAQERLAAAVAADGGRCVWCAGSFDGLRRPTREHLVPRLKGGPSWAENELAACRRCNGARGHLGPVDWLEECRSRGWSPDADRLVTALTGLADAIVDLVSSGGTLRANHLVEVETIREVSARLVVNQAALKLQRDALRDLIDAFGRACER